MLAALQRIRRTSPFTTDTLSALQKSAPDSIPETRGRYVRASARRVPPKLRARPSSFHAVCFLVHFASFAILVCLFPASQSSLVLVRGVSHHNYCTAILSPSWPDENGEIELSSSVDEAKYYLYI